MPYFQQAQERPRQKKRFLTVREIEDMATEGHLEIVHDEGLVITDAGREAAHDLGVRIVKPAQQTVSPDKPQFQPTQSGASSSPAISDAIQHPMPVPSHVALTRDTLQSGSAHVGALKASTAGRDLSPRRGLRQQPTIDPLVWSVVDAVRANLTIVTTIAMRR